MTFSKRKQNIISHYDQLSATRDNWIQKNKYFYSDDRNYMRFLVGSGQRILEIGSGTGDLLASLQPSHGVGIDISAGMTQQAKNKYPDLTFLTGDIEDINFLGRIKGPFDIIILSDAIGLLDDCQNTLKSLHRLCTPQTRLIVSYYSWTWEPFLKLAEKLSLKMPAKEMNWLSSGDVVNFLSLADFQTVKVDWRQLVPKRLLGLGYIINKFIGTLPIIRHACLRNYLVARPIKSAKLRSPSTTILIPCKNESGNIENAVKRLPRFCKDIEIIFVEGNSSDNTADEIKRVIKKYPLRDIKMFVQDGIGKGDAVRKGFANARGDILMILDADLTVPPEDLPKFYEAISSGKGEFINGSRLVYPMEAEAMRFLNFIANRIFSYLFTWLLNQRYTDTLCGTKVLSRVNYLKIQEERDYFGDFDPFGDFDLIFGATKLNLKIVEVPIRYAAREYGETQISRFRHGILLLRMVVFAYRKLKII